MAGRWNREARIEAVRRKLMDAVSKWKPGEGLVPARTVTPKPASPPAPVLPLTVLPFRPPPVESILYREVPSAPAAPLLQHAIQVERATLQYCLDAIQAGSPASCIQAAAKLRALLFKK